MERKNRERKRSVQEIIYKKRETKLTGAGLNVSPIKFHATPNTHTREKENGMKGKTGTGRTGSGTQIISGSVLVAGTRERREVDMYFFS